MTIVIRAAGHRDPASPPTPTVHLPPPFLPSSSSSFPPALPPPPPAPPPVLACSSRARERAAAPTKNPRTALLFQFRPPSCSVRPRKKGAAEPHNGQDITENHLMPQTGGSAKVFRRFSNPLASTSVPQHTTTPLLAFFSPSLSSLSLSDNALGKAASKQQPGLPRSQQAAA